MNKQILANHQTMHAIKQDQSETNKELRLQSALLVKQKADHNAAIHLLQREQVTNLEGNIYNKRY